MYNLIDPMPSKELIKNEKFNKLPATAAITLIAMTKEWEKTGKTRFSFEEIKRLINNLLDA